MTLASRVMMSPRMEEAVAELEELIRGRYPEATFDVGQVVPVRTPERNAAIESGVGQ